MKRDVIKYISDKMNSFSKGQRAIARYIVNSYDKAAFMTANELGRSVGVSESTVVRFAAQLGYDGYPGMQRALQEMIKSKLTSVQRMEVGNDRIMDVLPTVLQSDIENIRCTLEENSREDFNTAVDKIIKARRIYILGVRSSAAIASFMAFYFNLIFENVKLISTNSASEMFEQMLRVSPEDVVIAISFPRYSKRTVQAMNYSANMGACVIAITDSPESPVAGAATHLLLARSDMVSFVDSLTAPMSLVNALIVAVGRRNNEKLAATFEKLENIWDEYEVYEKI
ncbi:MAG: MurR/RpiR family transcriptional regulator [Oscillospiraceae bacterium]